MTSTVHVPPQNLRAESEAIASIMREGSADDVIGFLYPKHFYLESNQIIYQAIIDLAAKGGSLDTISVADELRRTGKLEKAGGEERLIELFESVVHGLHAKYCAGLIIEAARRRFADVIAKQLSREAHDLTTEFDEIIASADSKLMNLLAGQADSAIPAIDYMHMIADGLGKEPAPALTTGFHELDRRIRGLTAGQLVIPAARTRHGKTAFMICLILHVAGAGTPVLVITLEQPGIEFSERLICNVARVDIKTLRSVGNPEAIQDSINKAMNHIGGLPIIIDQTPTRSVAQIAAQARVERRRRNIGLVVIDYLQLLMPADKKAQREPQVAEMTRSLKLLARTLEIPVVCAAQLNREAEKQDRPRLSNLRESGAVEQDADLVFLLDRPSLRNNNAAPTEAVLYLEKSRGSDTAEIPLYWHGPSMTFMDGTNKSQIPDFQ